MKNEIEIKVLNWSLVIAAGLLIVNLVIFFGR